MNCKFVILIIVVGSCNLWAQNDSLKLKSSYSNLQSTIGISVGDHKGNVSEFNTGLIGLEMTISKEVNSSILGININYLSVFNEKFIPVPVGYRPTVIPRTLLLGLTYGKVFGRKEISHLHGSIGLNYGWMIYKQIDNKLGGFHGLVPQFEIGSAIKIGKSKMVENSFTSFLTPKSDYSVKNRFIDIFLSWKPLLFANENAQGSMIIGGIRFKQSRYYFRN